MLGIIPGMTVYFKRADRTMECFRKEGPYGKIMKIWIDKYCFEGVPSVVGKCKSKH